jgi:hypothetical protein
MNKATRDYNKTRIIQTVDIVNLSASTYNLCNEKSFIDVILTRYNLQEYYNQYKLHELTAGYYSSHLYHGKNHTELMILNCYEGALWEKLDASTIRSLLVAAIFHDSRHSLGKFDDSVNIKNAVKDLKTKHSKITELVTNKVIEEKFVLSEKELTLAVACIRHTKYPYIKNGYINTYSSSVPFRIIRDADLMNIYSSNREEVLNLYIGLYLEATLQHEISVTDFIQKCFVFLNSVRWYSVWAKKKAFDLNWPLVVKNTISHLTTNINLFKI